MSMSAQRLRKVVGRLSLRQQTPHPGLEADTIDAELKPSAIGATQAELLLPEVFHGKASNNFALIMRRYNPYKS